MLTMRPDGPLLSGLREFIATLPPDCTIVEVGCYRGEATREFLARALAVVCVDPWLDYTDCNDGIPDRVTHLAQAEAEFDRAIQPFYGRVAKLKMPSITAALLLGTALFDAVYIDGRHEEAAITADIAVWLPHIKPGGILACHDYGNPTFAGVTRAVDRAFPAGGMTYPDTTWAFRTPTT
jgi:hypothetical protein